MKIIDRYITKEFFKILLIILLAFVCIYLIVDLFDHVDNLVNNHLPISVLVKYLIFKIPLIFFQVSPVAMLLSTLLLLGNFIKYNEIVSLKASGVSVYRLTIPFIVLGLVICIGNFVLNEIVIPPSAMIMDYNEKLLRGRAVQQPLTQNKIWYVSKDNTIYNIQLIDRQRSVMEGVTILKLDNKFRLIERIDAKSAVWDEEKKWELKDGFLRKFFDRAKMGAESFNSKSLTLDESINDFQQVEKEPEAMSFKELSQYIKRLKNCGYGYDQYLVDLHIKISIPFASLIMIIIGIPFGLKFKKGSIAVSLVMCILIAFSYWIILAITIPLGRANRINPFLAAWLANFLFAAVGGCFFTTIKS
ncbi:MAG: LPS export ABC transporter permease LptG [bacterium]